jgi:hypothetical protein
MNLKRRRLLTFIAALLVATAGTPIALADTVEDEIRLLREQILALSERLDELAGTNEELRMTNARLVEATEQNEAMATAAAATAETAIAQSEEQAAASSWTDTLRWTGDFRYRYERIGVEDVPTRDRSRIRARAALVADLFEDMEVGIGLASGGEDPVSANQTLGGGGSTKDVGLDLAYFDWSGLDNTHLLGGKFKNILKPVAKNSMLWDSDWRPEGTALTWDNDSFFVSAVGTWLESDSKVGTEFAWIAEAGFKLKFGDSGKFRAGIGYHQFDIAGSPSFFDDGDFFGNSSVMIGKTQVYAYNYHGLELFGELGFNIGKYPTMLFVDYVQNQEAPQFDTGYIVGARFGSAKAPGSWDLAWAYEDLEADAALGLLVDSDFGGGGTDARGHIFKGTWMFKKNFSGKFTYFLNQIDGDLGNEKDFDRLMLDLNFKF